MALKVRCTWRHLVVDPGNWTPTVLLKSIHYFANKGLSSQSYGFSSSHVWMSELDHKEN